MLLAARDVPLPSRYSLEPGDWDTGLGCVVRAASNALGRDDLEVTRVHTASVAVPLHDSEELISNIVRLAPSRPDGGLPDVSARKAVAVVVVVLVVMVMAVVVVMCLSHDSELTSNIVRLSPGLPDVSARNCCGCCCCCCGGGGGDGGGGGGSGGGGDGVFVARQRRGHQ